MIDQLFKERRKELDVFKSLWKKASRPRAGLSPSAGKPDTACPGCGASILTEELDRALRVCPHCGRHLPLDARTRIQLVADEGTFSETNASLCRQDPLHFPGYAQKLTALEKKTGLPEAVVTGICRIGGYEVVLGVMDNRFFMASMGSAAGEKITRAIELCHPPQTALGVFSAPRAVRGCRRASILADANGQDQQRCGALTAGRGCCISAYSPTPPPAVSPPALPPRAILSLAEPGALIGFAGPRVIEQTIRRKLPEDFQQAEFAGAVRLFG